jgi:hypothetical protein
LRDLFVSRGVPLLASDAGAAAFVAEVCAAGNGEDLGDVDIVIASS